MLCVWVSREWESYPLFWFAVAGLPVGGGYTRGGAAGRPGFGAFDPRGPPPPMPPNFDRGFQQRGGYGDCSRDRRTGYGFDRPANGSARRPV